MCIWQLSCVSIDALLREAKEASLAVELLQTNLATAAVSDDDLEVLDDSKRIKQLFQETDRKVRAYQDVFAVRSYAESVAWSMHRACEEAIRNGLATLGEFKWTTVGAEQAGPSSSSASPGCDVSGAPLILCSEREIAELRNQLNESRSTVAEQGEKIQSLQHEVTTIAGQLKTEQKASKEVLADNSEWQAHVRTLEMAGTSHVGAMQWRITAGIIRQSDTLTSMNLRNNFIGDARATVLAKAIGQSSTLTTVCLHSNDIRDAGAMALAEAIKQSRTLTTLDLSKNEIRDAGAMALAEAIKQSRTLTTLDLSNNEIGDAGATVLAKAIGQSRTLTTLDLSNNEIGDAGAAKLGAAIQQRCGKVTVKLKGNRMAVGGV